MQSKPKGSNRERITTLSNCRHHMGRFWRNAKLDRKTKMQVYEAIMSAKLMYALDITPMMNAGKDRIYAAFLKGLRQILSMKSTFAQKKAGEELTNTNQNVLDKANKGIKDE